jgi:EAL domain-containing protein (putative c-di-GMP-specific phosphodiesterase class I)
MQLQATEFVDEVRRVLEESGLSRGQLVLEITESAMFRDPQATIARLEALRALGVRIAIDDFGTGYASLTYLRRFPVDIVKIAQEFVAHADDGPQEWAFTGAILALGQRLGLEVVAEGVEDEGQVRRLIDLGCRYAQGYFFGRPGPIGAPEFRAAVATAPEAPARALGGRLPVEPAR